MSSWWVREFSAAGPPCTCWNAESRVTLLDAWGPGNARASSGGETRIMRGTYGPDQPYTELGSAGAEVVGEV